MWGISYLRSSWLHLRVLAQSLPCLSHCGHHPAAPNFSSATLELSCPLWGGDSQEHWGVCQRERGEVAWQEWPSPSGRWASSWDTRFILPLGIRSCMVPGWVALPGRQRSAWGDTPSHFLSLLPYLTLSIPPFRIKWVAPLQVTQARIETFVPSLLRSSFQRN